MTRAVICLIFIAIFGYLSGLEVILERAEVEYYNPKYMRYLNLSIRRVGRRKPYAMNIHGRSLVTADNSFTISFQLLELMSSGQYHPTPVQFSIRLCEFFQREPLLGQLVQKALNLTCPLPAGEFHFPNILMDLSTFPHHLPFTWAHQSDTHTRTDFSLLVSESKELVFNVFVYATMSQKSTYRG